MSDPLASFFAKKDKKKGVRKADDARPTEKEAKAAREKKSNVGVNLRLLDQDDAEWNDYEEDREKDYSNLKIQTLVLKDREEEFREQKLRQEAARREQNEGPNGAWSGPKADSGAASDAPAEPKEDTPAVAPEEPKKEPAPAAPAKYVPPSQRAGATQMQPMRKKGVAPQISSEAEFPTLG